MQLVKPKILIAEPEQMFAEAVAYVLEDEGFETFTAHDSRETLEKAREIKPHLCVLSAALLPVSGLPLCCDLRQSGRIGLDAPLLLLATDTHEETRVAMLECGVDDYLVKPFGMREFMARVRGLLRRAPLPAGAQLGGEIVVGDFSLNLNERLLTIDSEAGKKTFCLPRKEFQLLQLLMSQAGHTLSHQTIIQHVWGSRQATQGQLQSLYVHMRFLRCKVEENPNDPKHLVGLRNVGFRFLP